MAKATSPLVTVGKLHELDAGRSWPWGREAAIGEDHALAVPGEGTGDGKGPAEMAAAEQALDPEEAGHDGRSGRLASKVGRPASSSESRSARSGS